MSLVFVVTKKRQNGEKEWRYKLANSNYVDGTRQRYSDEEQSIFEWMHAREWMNEWMEMWVEEQHRVGALLPSVVCEEEKIER